MCPVWLRVLFPAALLAGVTSAHAQSADQLTEQAKAFASAGKQADAADTYARAAEAESKTPAPRLNKLADMHYESGRAYGKAGNKALAMQHYKLALALARQVNNEVDMIVLLTNMGILLLDDTNQLQVAVGHFTECLELAKKLKRQRQFANCERSLAIVYGVWGQYDKAVTSLQAAVIANRQIGEHERVALDLNSLGATHYKLVEYDKALTAYREALAIAQSVERTQTLNDKTLIAAITSNIMMIEGKSDPKKRIAALEQLIADNRKSANLLGLANGLTNLGSAHYQLGDNAQAIVHGKEALAVYRQLKHNNGIAQVLNNLGAWETNRSKSIEYFKECILLREEMRQVATGEARRDFLASIFFTYKMLLQVYVRMGDHAGAFAVMEQSKARMLSEQLAATSSLPKVTVEKVQHELPNDWAVLSFANADENKKVVLGLTKQRIRTLEVDEKTFISDALAKFTNPIQAHAAGQRGLKLKGTSSTQAPESSASSDKFDDIVNYYRSQLSNPAGQSRELGKLLYQLLIKPMEQDIAGKSTLLILPDGILGFLPFETLVDDDGRYLVEKYDVRYVQSLSVLAAMKTRRYDSKRKPMLAFGGAVYDPITYSTSMIDDATALATLSDRVSTSIASRGSVRDAYASLGVSAWQNLPGTLSEVKTIAEIVKEAEVLVGAPVSEDHVKALAKKGELAKYRVLHFATHGLVVPALPELSAVVLSQFKEEKGGEDGYLRAGEIAELNLRADFVNLSACETGLGKIYRGEGVVGLTQAFLLAGANGLSVSLWQVNDQSTSQFMTGMYRDAERAQSYGTSMTTMKRRFIKGEYGAGYQAPYFWAPFVYYGI